MDRISPLSCGSQEFSQCVEQATTAGCRKQAITLYRDFYRNPCFFEQLFGQKYSFLDHVHFPLDPLIAIAQTKEASRFVIKTTDDLLIESVIIVSQKRRTVCVSSQVGCRIGCQFCRTGKSGFCRNLTTEEIVQQVVIASWILNDCPTNVVFMGAGEPGDNFDTVLRATAIMSDDCGMAIGQRHITISTSGDVPAILRLASARISPRLCVSLHAATPDLRTFLVPGRRESLEQLHEAMNTYCAKKNKEILISYVLIGGVNDSEKEAMSLARYLHGIRAKINIIPFNAHGHSSFMAPSFESWKKFTQLLIQEGIFVSTRHECGAEISAACGQLQGRPSPK